MHLPVPFGEALRRFANVNTKDTETELLDQEGKAFPFVKWVGGKRSLVETLTAKLPKTFGAYYEPFVGGGALFFETSDRLTAAFLSDTNIDLVITYNVIKRDLPRLLVLLKQHAERHTEDYYYKMRARHGLHDPIEIAARFLYLNKTCYNGLYRVNRKGEFNVPIGRYTNPGILQEKNLLLCRKALHKNVRIELKGFETIHPVAGDFVYFDPPYHPTTETSFTAYSKLDFTEKDQATLRDVVLTLHKEGVKVMLSNSNTPYIRSLYKVNAFKMETVHAPHLINCKSNGRESVEQLLITNY